MAGSVLPGGKPVNQQERPVSSPPQVQSLGQCLREQRLQGGISQEALAEMLGVSVRSIRRWEQDRAIPQEIARERLCQFLGIDPRFLLGASNPEEASPAAPAFWQIPFLRNPFFTGREAILRQLHEVLGHQQTAVLSRSSTLSGLGGIGKTQTALEYAYRYAADYTALFWINAETAESLFSSFATIAEVLDLPEKQEQESRRIVAAVTRWLTRQSGWLLIFDNIEDVELAKGFLPPARQGSLLLTSRNQALGLTTQTLHLAPMTPEESVRFLFHRARKLDFTVSLDLLAPADEAMAREITVAMGGLPLALDQAGAYMEETGCSMTEYYERYCARGAELLLRRGFSPGDYQESVITTLSLSIEKLARVSPAALDLLRLCSLLAGDAIPEEIVAPGRADLGPHLRALANDLLAWDTTIALLRRFSLVERDHEAKTLTVHRLVQLVVRESIEGPEQRGWAERAVRAVNSLLPDGDLGRHEIWVRWQRCLPHTFPCAALINQWQLTGADVYRLLYQTAVCLLVGGRYAEAEHLYRQTLTLCQQELGPEHLQTGEVLNDLGLLCYDTGRYQEAELLYQQALSIFEQAVGEEHLFVAHSRHNLGLLYCEQQQQLLAEPLLQKALHTREHLLGPDAPAVAESLHVLAILSQYQQRFEEAEVLLQRSLAIRRRAFGDDHPAIAQSLTRLGKVYLAQGNETQAEQVLLQALVVREKAQRLDDPPMVHTLQALGDLYLAQGKCPQAEHYLRRALDICEKLLPPEHIQRQATLRSLAELAQCTSE